MNGGEVNSASDTNVRGRPGLQQLEVTAFAPLFADVGNNFEFYVRAFTSEGYVDSDHNTFTLADVPDAPPTAPTIT